METFGELLEKYIGREGIGQEPLGKKVGYSKSSISNLCNDKVKNYDCDKIKKCTQVLNLNPDERRELMIAAKCVPDESDVPLVPIINVPINRPRQFFGRQTVVKRILNKWNGHLQHVAVIGQRRSGKTSLLHYIKNIHRAVPLRDGQHQDGLLTNTQFVFVDFQAAGMTEPINLFSYILQELHFTIPRRCDLRQFTEVMRNQLHQPTVLLMDRIDVGLEASGLDYRFWWGIRSLVLNGTNGNLGLLLASPELPTEVRPRGGESQPSPFLNIIAEIVELGPLADEEARELLRHTPQPFDEADTEWILTKSGCWPALLQVLSDARLRAIDENEIGDAWKKEGLERIQNDGYLSNLYNNRNL